MELGAQFGPAGSPQRSLQLHRDNMEEDHFVSMRNLPLLQLGELPLDNEYTFYLTNSSTQRKNQPRPESPTLLQPVPEFELPEEET